MSKKTPKGDNTNHSKTDRELSEYFESLRSTDGVYTPEQMAMRFATTALYVGMNVRMTTDEDSIKLPRITGTTYNGEAEVILKRIGKDMKVAFRGDDKSHAYFEEHFVNPLGKFHPNNVKNLKDLNV